MVTTNVKSTSCCSTVRLATLPPSHPLFKIIERSANRYIKSHCSPLYRIFHFAQLTPSSVEKILSSFQPNFIPAVSTSIAPSCRQAVSDAKKLHLTHEVRVYSDGSMFKGGVSTAASLYQGNMLQKSLTFHLGSELDHSVYKAEIVGMLLSVHLLNSLSHCLLNPTICLDNQLSIRALNNLKPYPAHYLLDHMHNAAKALKEKEQLKANGNSERLFLHIIWTPGHEGIPENELVNSLAKEAAKGKSSPHLSLPPLLCKLLPQSASTVK